MFSDFQINEAKKHADTIAKCVTSFFAANDGANLLYEAIEMTTGIIKYRVYKTYNKQLKPDLHISYTTHTEPSIR